MKLSKILAVLVILFVTSQVSNAAIIPITNASVTEKEIDLNTAIALYSAKIQNWKDGQPVVVVVLPRDNPIEREFLFDVLRITPFSYYDTLSLMTPKRKPKIIRVMTEEEMVKTVLRTEGAIGFIRDRTFHQYKNEVHQLRIK